MDRWHLLLVVACITAPLAPAQEIERPSQSASANARTKQNTAEPPSAFPASAALAIQRSLESIAAAQVAQAGGSKSDEEKKREHDDLEAQQEMAFWAKAMFLAALFSTVVSAGAAWLLYLTLKESRRAAYASLKAAVAARQSARGADESSRRQLRAYILPYFASAKWEDEKGVLLRSVRITVKCKNTGQTPGLKVRSCIWGESKTIGDTDFPDRADDPVQPKSVHAPGQKTQFIFWYQSPIASTEDILDVWRRGDETLFVWGRIDYEDVFGDKWHSTFRLMIPSEGVGDASGSFISCAEGNEAT